MHASTLDIWRYFLVQINKYITKLHSCMKETEFLLMYNIRFMNLIYNTHGTCVPIKCKAKKNNNKKIE